MTEHDRALRAARVVLAGHVLVVGKGFAVRRRAGEDVMPVWRIAAPVDDLAFFRKIVCLAELVVGAVQIVDARRNHHTFGIRPRTLADAVACVYGTGALRREISVPSLGSRARGSGKRLAMLVGAGQTAEIGAFSAAHTGHKKTHIGLLRMRGTQQSQTDDQRRADPNCSHRTYSLVGAARRRAIREDLHLKYVGIPPCQNLSAEPQSALAVYCASVTGSSQVTCSLFLASCMAMCSMP